MSEKTRSELQVGDETMVVVTDPNESTSKDPFTQIDGRAAFIRFPDDYQPEFGESVRVRIADENKETFICVAVGELDE